MNEVIKQNIGSKLRNALSGRELSYSDFHIDQISNDFKNPDTWIDGGILSYKMTLDIINEHKYDLEIALSFDLKFSEYEQGINFRNIAELENEFGYTPPSIYFYNIGNSPLTDDLKRIQLSIFKNIIDISCYYCEYKETDEFEYRRFLWLC